MEHLDAEIYQLLRQVNGKMSCSFQEFLSPIGITLPQAMILIHLHERKTLRLSELAEHLKMTCSNCSVICQRLEKSGMISRIRDRQDQRAVNLQLTPRAQEVMETLSTQMTCMQQNLLKNATLEERLKIAEGLRLLNELFQQGKKGEEQQ